MVATQQPQTTKVVHIHYGDGHMVLHDLKGRWHVTYQGKREGERVKAVLVHEWLSIASERIHPEVALAVAANFAQNGVLIEPGQHHWRRVDAR